jgi:hypothetical protein
MKAPATRLEDSVAWQEPHQFVLLAAYSRAILDSES